MQRFHINKHGVPAPCRAKRGNCPLGGDGQHFSTKGEAQSYADKVNQEEFGLLGGLKKTLGIGQIKANNIHEYRGKYLKKKVKNDPQDKLDSLVYVINTIEEEDGAVGETSIGRTANRIHSFDAEKITPERRFSDLLERLNQLPDQQLNRHLNKLDDALGVDSTSGFVSKESKQLKKSLGIGKIKADNIHDYRGKYLKKIKVNEDPQDKLKSLVYAINLIEEEDGTVGETAIGRTADRVISFDAKNITPERRFSDLIDSINKLPDVQVDRYLNKLDDVLGVDSTSGFVSPKSKDNL